MNGVHDLGGRHGFGPIERTDDEDVFKDRWEAAVFTMTNALMASGVIKNVDQFRHAIERIDPVSYLADTYYGRWLGGIETLLIESGTMTREALDTRAVSLGADPAARVAARPDTHPDDVPDQRLPPAPTAQRPSGPTAKFAVGQRVRARRSSTRGHTRLPTYAAGAAGEVIAVHGVWVYPDSNAHGKGEDPQPLYTVAFAGTELWGEAAQGGDSVCVDLFEPYLEDA